MALKQGVPEVLTDIQRPKQRTKLMGLPQNAQFTYWVDPVRVRMRAGAASYNPIAVPIMNGAQGVLDDDPTMIDALQVKNGRIEVPGDFPCEAWGKTAPGYRLRLPLGEDRNGKPLYHWCDVWTRYRQVGTRLIRDFDHAGWAKFCADVASLEGVTAKPDPAIVAAETSRLRNAAAIQQSLHGSATSDAIAAEILAQVTPPKTPRSRKAQPNAGSSTA